MEVELAESLDAIEIGASGITEIVQNVKTIVATLKGSVPLDRDFGVAWGFIDMPTPAARAQFMADVVEEVEKQEPRVNVTGVLWKDSTEQSMDGHLVPVIRIRIKDGYL